jgi:site-specific DNA-methyltransferase (adenine-specific)
MDGFYAPFYKKQPTYNPQMTLRSDKNKRNNKNEKFNTESSAKLGDSFKKTGMNDYCYPKNFIKVNVQRGLHPTQKPLNLLEYLVKTYTNENDTILDNTMGSGTTMLACKNLNRNGIGIEINEDYFNIASERVGKKKKRKRY